MSFSITSTGMNDEADRFPSLGALRIAHNYLLRQYREQRNTPAILSAIARLISQGKLTGALLDSEENRWAAQGLLDYWSSILYRAGYEPPDATLDEFDPTFAPELADTLCPYVGLTAFREDQQYLFYGREALLAQLIEKLQANRLLTVVGAPGSGKSSVVLGGLIPQLKTNALSESENWQYYPPIMPGRNPLESLARSLCPSHADPSQWISEFVAGLRHSSDYLTQFIATVSPTQPTVLVVDQVEEIFTLCRDEASRQAFADSLLNLIQSPGLRHTVILTVWSDFEPQIAQVTNFREVFNQSQVQMTNLSAHELREAIEKPAELVGLTFEAGIVHALIQDTLYEPSGLSLLQFALLRLWEQRNRNKITWRSYHELGRGSQALTQTADQLFLDLTPEEQETLKQIMLNLARFGKGLSLVKNRITRSALYDLLKTSEVTRPIEGNQAECTPIDLSQTPEPMNAPEPEMNALDGKSSVDFEQMMQMLASEFPYPFASNLPKVQDRFDRLLKRRIETEVAGKPPLFPWETDHANYAAEAPMPAQLTAVSFWSTQLAQLQLPVPMPEALLADLLVRCQTLVAVPLREGAKLVKAVEEWFPNQSLDLNQLAGMVMVSPARSGNATIKQARLSGFPAHYDQANSAQQMALALLTAREIFDSLTLVISSRQPVVERQWNTAIGTLTLKAGKAKTNELLIRGQFPCGGKLQLQSSDTSTEARRNTPGWLQVSLSYPSPDQTYLVEIHLDAPDSPTMTFGIQFNFFD
jgi:hypothetical protein